MTTFERVKRRMAAVLSATTGGSVPIGEHTTALLIAVTEEIDSLRVNPHLPGDFSKSLAEGSVPVSDLRSLMKVALDARELLAAVDRETVHDFVEGYSKAVQEIVSELDSLCETATLRARAESAEAMAKELAR